MGTKRTRLDEDYEAFLRTPRGRKAVKHARAETRLVAFGKAILKLRGWANRR